MIELYYNFQSDNGTLTPDHALSQWSARYLESMMGLKDLRQATRLPNLMVSLTPALNCNPFVRELRTWEPSWSYSVFIGAWLFRSSASSSISRYHTDWKLA